MFISLRSIASRIISHASTRYVDKTIQLCHITTCHCPNQTSRKLLQTNTLMVLQLQYCQQKVNDLHRRTSTDKLRKIVEEKNFIVENFEGIWAVESIHHLLKRGYRHVGNVVDGVCEDLIGAGRLHEALHFTKSLVEIDGVVQHQTYNKLLKGFVQLRKSQGREEKERGKIVNEFTNLIMYMSERGYEVNAVGKHHILHMASLVGNSQLAQSCLDELLSDEVYVMKASDFASLLLSYITEAKMKNNYDKVAGAIEFCNNMRGDNYTTSVVDILVTDLIKDGLLNESVDVVRGLLAAGVLQQRTYTRLLKGFVDKRKHCSDPTIVKSFSDFINFMNEEGYDLDIFGVFQMLRMASYTGNVQLAHECFQELKASDEFRDLLPVFTLLLQTHLKEAERNNYIHGELVFGCFDEMMDAGYIPDKWRLFDVLRLAAITGSSRYAQICFDHLKADGQYIMSDAEPGYLLQSYINEAKKTDSFKMHKCILKCLNDALEDGFKVAQSNIESFVEFSVRSGAWEPAREVLEKISDNKDFYIGYMDVLVEIDPLLKRNDEYCARKIGDRSCYSIQCGSYISSFISPGLNAQRFGTVKQEAGDLLENFDQLQTLQRIASLHRSGYKSVDYIAHAVILGLLERNSLEQALDLTKIIIDKNLVRLEQKTLVYLFKGIFKHMKKECLIMERTFLDLVEFLEENGYQPNEHLHAELLRFASHLGNTKLARTCFESLRASNTYVVHEVHYRLMLQAFFAEIKKKKKNQKISQESCVREALDLFNEIHSKGFKLDAGNLTEVLRIAALGGDSKSAQLSFDLVKSIKNYPMQGVQHGLLLRSYVNESNNRNIDHNQIVLRIFNDLVDSRLDVISLNIKIFIEHCVKNGLQVEARQALRKLGKNVDLHTEYLDRMCNMISIN